MSRPLAFAVLTLGTGGLMASASAPSPLYPVYRDRWDFSVAMLTVVFAVYVVGLLGALLTVGSLSDKVGRRHVLAAAFALGAASMTIFWRADGLLALLTARFVQGVASGTAMSGLAAGLVDVSPANRPHLGARVTATATSVGMASGAGVVGLLLDRSGRPDQYVFPVLAALFLCLAVAMLFLPDTITRQSWSWASLKPRLSMEPSTRDTFWSTVPTTVAGWTATGLFLALVPSLAREVLHVDLAAVGGLSITALYLAVTAGGVWAARLRFAAIAVLGGVLMTAGALTLLLAVVIASTPVFVAGSLTIGIGVGLTFNGNLRAIGAVTTADTRSATFSGVYLVSYASLSVPSLLAGIAERSWGPRTTADAYLAFITIVAAGATIHSMSRMRWFASGGRRRRSGSVLDSC